MPLTPQQRKALKARAHSLHPVVLIGNNGVSATVLKEIDVALRAHELIKVHIAGEDRASRETLAIEICAAVGAEAVQSIGRMLVLFREKPPESEAAVRRTNRARRHGRQTKRSFQNDS